MADFLPKIPGGDGNKKAIIFLFAVLLLVALPLVLLGSSMIGDRLGEGTSDQFGGGSSGSAGGGTTDCSKLPTTDTLDGWHIPSSKGKFGVEQHLTSSAQITKHYQEHESFGVPAVKNGAAGGFGSFAGGNPVPISREAWYSNMRWTYVNWAWNGRAQKTPKTNEGFSWLKSKKVVFKFNGKCIVTSIEETGPAPWTGTGRSRGNPTPDWQGYRDSDPPNYNGRIAGASPEVARALGLTTNNVVEVGWAADQSVPLGTVTQGTSTAQPASEQGTSLPVRQGDMTNSFNSSLHDCSVSKPSGCNDAGHRAMLGSLGSYRTNIPEKASSGEAADVQAKENAPVYAPFSGKITFKGRVSKSKPSIGSMLVLQSNDGRMSAAMLHLNNTGIIEKNTVKSGEQVGTLIPMTQAYGNTHLHFELWVSGKAINAGGPGSGATGKKIWEQQKKALGY